MTYPRFEDLPVWKGAMELAVRIFDWIHEGALKSHPGLRDQLERAVISISNNIAEGYERGTHEELVTFLYYARGSAAETRSMLALLTGSRRWNENLELIEELSARSLEVSRQLGAWLDSLKNSASEGPRFQNDRTRQSANKHRRRAEFLAYLKRVQNKVPGATAPVDDARPAAPTETARPDVDRKKGDHK
jgi:four helix bundle protein